MVIIAGAEAAPRMRNSFDTLKKIVDQNHAMLNLQGVYGIPTNTKTKD